MLSHFRALAFFLITQVMCLTSNAASPGEKLDITLKDGRTFENVEVLRSEDESLWIMSGKTLVALKKREILSEKPAAASSQAPAIQAPTKEPAEIETKEAAPPAEVQKPKEEIPAIGIAPSTAAPIAAPPEQTLASGLLVPALALLVVFAVGVIIWLFRSSRTHQRKAVELEHRFKPIIDIDEAVKESQEKLAMTAKGVVQKQQEIHDLNLALASLKKTLAIYESEGDLVACGHYRPQFSFATSEEFKEAIIETRELQRAMIKEEKAASCPHNWTVNGSEAEGRKATKRTLRLLLRAFNGECDAVIAGVSWSNVDRMHERMKSAFEAINKLGESYKCSISHAYLMLKLKELGLTHEHEARLQKEKEEQRALRERMRDEEKARREMEDALKLAARDEERAKEALDKARSEVAKASGEKEASLNSKIVQLEEKLREALANKERALSRAQQTRSGHVYIISNIGSFGEAVFKIGMTRRLDPFERVYELGDASVPFDFDVHGMIYTEDAPALEAKLHEHFEQKRVNLVNERKEFFHVTIADVQAAVNAMGAEVILTKLAEAREYRETVERRKSAQESVKEMAG